MSEVEFLQQAFWLRDQRGYKPAWVWSMFKTKFGRWCKKTERADAEAGGPVVASAEFLGWVEQHHQAYSTAQQAINAAKS